MTTPGLLISAPASGSGKTTVMLGLLRAFRNRGVAVQPFKCGPDYIDPGFHRAASGQASVNLDSWAMGRGMIGGLTQMAGGSDLALAEGAMGLFDGVATPGAWGTGAAADIAAETGWPVVLVLDCGGQAQSAGAVALGFAQFRDGVNVAGVILNRVASPRHDAMLREGIERAGLPVFGTLPRSKDIELPSRHLGLVQAEEQAEMERILSAAAAFVEAHVDLDALRAAARSGAASPATPIALRPPGQRIAIARDAAFSFTYPHALEAWRLAGAELLPFSPLADEAPDDSADICWLPGGYPELHAGRIAGNDRFLSGLRAFAGTRPVHGECGGYMVLGAGLEDKDGTRHQMAGLLGLETSFAKRKMHLGYRAATLAAPMPGYAPGALLRGHEFHYATILSQPDAPLASVRDAAGADVAETGSTRGHVSGTFFHLIAEGA